MSNNIMDTVDIQLPLGLIGLELEPKRTEGRIKIGCRVRRWNVPSKDMDLLGPGTEIYAIDSIYVADRTFKEVIKILKKSSKRLLTIAKKTTILGDERSPAFLIRAMLQSEMNNNFEDSPKKENTSLIHFSPMSSFSSPSSTKSLNVKHTSTTQKITRTETEIVDSTIEFESNISGEENNARTHSAMKIVRTTITNEENVFDTLTMQTSTSTSDCSPTFISDISSCNSNHSNNIITISSTFLNTSQVSTIDNSCVTDDSNSSSSSSKVMLVLNGQQQSSNSNNRNHDNNQLARTDENMFHLQSALVDRENKIQSLLMEINSLKRNARGSAGQIMFLEFQVEKLQSQKRKEEEKALTLSQPTTHTLEILRSPVSDQSKGLNFTPDREAWLLHWRKSRAVLACLHLPENNSSNRQTRQSIEIANETKNTSSTNAVTSMRAVTNQHVIENVSSSNDTDIKNNKENGFKAPIFSASESDEIKVLSRQLTEQSMMNGKLKGKLRSWVSMQLQALRLLTDEEEDEEYHPAHTKPCGIHEEMEEVERQVIGHDSVSSPPSYSSSSSSHSPTTPSVRIIKNLKRLTLPNAVVQQQTIDKISSFSSLSVDSKSPAKGRNDSNGKVTSSNSFNNSEVVCFTQVDDDEEEPMKRTTITPSVGSKSISISISKDLAGTKPFSSSSSLDTSCPSPPINKALLSTTSFSNKNEFTSSSSSTSTISSISSGSCSYDSQYDLAPSLPSNTNSTIANNNNRVVGPPFSSQSTRRPLYELLQSQECHHRSNPLTCNNNITTNSSNIHRPFSESSLSGSAGVVATVTLSKNILSETYLENNNTQNNNHNHNHNNITGVASLYSNSSISVASRGKADIETHLSLSATQTAFSETGKLRNPGDWDWEDNSNNSNIKFQKPRSNSINSSSSSSINTGVTDSSISLLLSQYDKENRLNSVNHNKTKSLTEMEKLRENNLTVKDDIRRFRGTLQKIREDCSGSDRFSSKEGGSGGGSSGVRGVLYK